MISAGNLNLTRTNLNSSPLAQGPVANDVPELVAEDDLSSTFENSTGGFEIAAAIENLSAPRQSAINLFAGAPLSLLAPAMMPIGPSDVDITYADHPVFFVAQWAIIGGAAVAMVVLSHRIAQFFGGWGGFLMPDLPYELPAHWLSGGYTLYEGKTSAAQKSAEEKIEKDPSGVTENLKPTAQTIEWQLFSGAKKPVLASLDLKAGVFSIEKAHALHLSEKPDSLKLQRKEFELGIDCVKRAFGAYKRANSVMLVVAAEILGHAYAQIGNFESSAKYYEEAANVLQAMANRGIKSIEEGKTPAGFWPYIFYLRFRAGANLASAAHSAMSNINDKNPELYIYFTYAFFRRAVDLYQDTLDKAVGIGDKDVMARSERHLSSVRLELQSFIGKKWSEVENNKIHARPYHSWFSSQSGTYQNLFKKEVLPPWTKFIALPTMSETEVRDRALKLMKDLQHKQELHRRLERLHGEISNGEVLVEGPLGSAFSEMLAVVFRYVNQALWHRETEITGPLTSRNELAQHLATNRADASRIARELTDNTQLQEEADEMLGTLFAAANRYRFNAKAQDAAKLGMIGVLNSHPEYAGLFIDSIITNSPNHPDLAWAIVAEAGVAQPGWFSPETIDRIRWWSEKEPAAAWALKNIEAAHPEHFIGTGSILDRLGE